MLATLTDSPLVAIGEVGLDFLPITCRHRTRKFGSFEDQLDLSDRLDCRSLFIRARPTKPRSRSCFRLVERAAGARLPSRSASCTATRTGPRLEPMCNSVSISLSPDVTYPKADPPASIPPLRFPAKLC